MTPDKKLLLNLVILEMNLALRELAEFPPWRGSRPLQGQGERPQTNVGNQPPVGGRQGSSEGDDFVVRAPSISLPKGGGAIRGIGEKFAANPVTGTGSLTVPIATSPGR